MTPDISLVSLLVCALLLAIPLFTSRYLKLGMGKSIAISVARMSLQLFLVGLLLTYLFDVQNMLLTGIWLVIMISFATFTTIRNAGLAWKIFLWPIVLAYLLSALPILFYFNGLVARVNVMDPRFAIAILGMLLGNAIRGNVVGLNGFVQDIKRNRNRYLYRLSLGATAFEASKPFFSKNLASAIKPTLASVATMGIVFLPGMMTGQIIAGQDPVGAIKYQIAIMIVIFATTVLSILLVFIMSRKVAFDGYGMLRGDIFSKQK